MNRLRHGDWLCALAALLLLVVLVVSEDDWGSLGLPTAVLAAAAIVAALAAALTTATRTSPTAPVLALVALIVLALLTAVALLIEAAWLPLLVAVGLFLAAFLAMRDESQPAAEDVPVEVRRAPPAA